ncbi:MAG: hypothetical protein EOM20_05230 [Spartobacteria bacterium]|nr:hypothetical protein [Spartobacteria bacterium]
MMRYLSIAEVLDIHERLLVASGGMLGVRDLGALESAVSQPRATYGGLDLYPDLVAKATALCYSLVMNHAFVDGTSGDREVGCGHDGGGMFGLFCLTVLGG